MYYCNTNVYFTPEIRNQDTSSVCILGKLIIPFRSNVKVVACGKAVLSMARAVERILGPHITEGVVSVPTGSTEMAQRNCSHQLLAHDSRMRCVISVYHYTIYVVQVFL